MRLTATAASPWLFQQIRISGDEMKTGIKRWTEVAIESVNYIIISYALSCMTFLFRSDWLFILFFASEIWLLSKYFVNLNKLTKNKIISGAVWICSMVIVGLLMYFVGYVDGTPVPFAS